MATVILTSLGSAIGNSLGGGLGTEWAVGTHVAGERFVLLDGNLAKDAIPNSLLNLTRYYKPVSVGSSLGATDAQSFAYMGRALKPLSPVHISGARDGGGNLTINWVRRTRLGGNWNDNVDVPLNESSESYVVEIMNGGNVVRTISGLSSASAGYPAADQTTDFGSPQSSVAVKVYQLSEIVGRGYAGTATV